MEGPDFLGEWLVVFNSPFVEEDRHSILDCNGINIFESIFDGGHRDFEVGL